MSGSGVFARDPDSILIFTRHEEEGAFTVEPVLRNFPPVTPFVIRWNYPTFEMADDLNPDDLRQSAGRKKQYDPISLLALIASTDELNPTTITDWANAGNCPRQTLADYTPEMRRKGWIKTVGEGKGARQFITQKGKDLVASVK
jgi:predicted transcriptional regulator